MSRRIAHAAQIAALVFAVALVPSAFAAKGGGNASGGSGSSSLSLSMVTDVNGNGLPNWGDTVTFKVSTTATASPYVDLTCSQNGTVVYSASSGFFASYPWPWTQNMQLGSQMWTGGNAACSARLYMFGSRGKKQTLATLAFTAYAA